MYLECVSCSKLGKACDGPNFVAMSAAELLEWCKLRKAHLGWSNAKLAEASNMPKGTIDRLFAGSHIDFRYETIRPMVMALAGGEFTGNPCPPVQVEPTPDPALVLQVHDLEKDLGYADKTIRNLEASLRSWKQAIYAMMILCAVLTVSLVGYITMDMNNTNIGLIREDYMSPVVLLPVLGIIAACVAAVLMGYNLKNQKQNN